MLKELFNDVRENINFFLDQIDLKKTEELLIKLAACQGVMIFSGVGKSGLIAEKISMTMNSVGSKAFYISPTNALHGDIGFVSSQDIFIALSKSGETDEILNLIPSIRNKGAQIVAIISNPRSRLAQAADFFIDLPIKKELCPFDIVPTSSTTMQMIFGDVLAIALMKKRQVTLDQFAQNHPAGRIGKRLFMKVKDLMISKNQLPTCGPKDHLVDVLVELSNKRCGCVLIIDSEQRLQGIFTDGDLRRSLQKHGAKSLNLTMENLMTKAARTISPTHLAFEAMKIMEGDQKNAITVLPVIEEENKIVGLIKLHDILQSGI